MRKIAKTTRSIFNIPVDRIAKLIEARKYDRHLRKLEKEMEEFMFGYDSPLLSVK